MRKYLVLLVGICCSIQILSAPLDVAQSDAVSSTIITADAGKILGPVNRQIFGHNLEAADPRGIFAPFTDKTFNVYTIKIGQGYWDADKKCMWPAMGDELKKVGASMMRYPGGCLTHNFDWRKTIGPIEQRGNKDWNFGLDEFLKFCKEANLEPVITVSGYVLPADELPQFSADLVEYLNAPAMPEHPWAMKRKQYGHPEPYNVKYFELGNESNHGNHTVVPGRVMTGAEYAQYAVKTAAAMKKVDPNIKIGLNLNEKEWDKTVLKNAGPIADFIVIHIYIPPFCDRMAAEYNTVMAVTFQERLETIMNDYRKLISEYCKKDLPFAITEYNTGNLGQMRFTYLSGLANAQLISLFIKPENNVLMANYWHFLNGFWGIVQSTDGVVTNTFAPLAFFRTWAEYLGDEIVSVDVKTPLLESPAIGGWGACTKKPSKDITVVGRVLPGNFITMDFSRANVKVEMTSSNSFRVHFDKRSTDMYANFSLVDRPASVPQGSPIMYRLRYKGRFIPAADNKGSGGMGLGMVDKRGWDATWSGIRVIGAEHVKDWTTFEGDFATLSDCPGAFLVARLETVTGPVSGTLEIKDIEVFYCQPESYPLYKAVTATAMLTKDKEQLTMVVFNRNPAEAMPVKINLSGFNAKYVEGTELYTADVASAKAVQGKKLTIDIKDNTASLTLPAHSMTALRFLKNPPALPAKKYSKILIMGNSLTKHGPSTQALGWGGNWGMAATALDKDYAHRLYKMICDAQGDKPELKVVTMLAKDTPYAKMLNPISEEFKTVDDLVAYKGDLVIVQVGGNLQPENATKEIYGKQLCDLLKKLKTDKNTVVCTSLWHRSPAAHLNENAAKEAGVVYVDIMTVSDDPKNSAAAEGHFKNDGVNWHPGDRGMNEIAKTIWKQLNSK